MPEPNVSIGILTDKEIRFDFYGEFRIPGAEKKYSGKFKARIEDNKIIIGHDKDEPIVCDTILFEPKDIETDSFRIRDVVIGKSFHWERKENQRFRGSLRLIIENRMMTAVNTLPVEEYLTSVISSEMSSNGSIELLRAHAIVSRGWLLSQLEKKNKKAINEIVTDDEIIRWYNRDDHKNYDFCADDHCQRYQGAARIVNDNAIRAIADTRGLVLKYEDKICDARYSKCCGGITEAFENVWEAEMYPYLTSIIDYKFPTDESDLDLTSEKETERWINGNPNAFCNTSDKKILSQILVDFDRSTNDFFRWKVEYSQEEISEIIKKKSGIDFGSIIELIPLKRGESGRIVSLKIVGSKKTLVIGKELEIRKILSLTHLYSSAFYLVREELTGNIPGKFILHGAGWGHGVGLCQIGAAVMGELGYGFDEILLHYFKGSKIQKAY